MEFCQKTYNLCFSFLPEDVAKSLFPRFEKKTFESGEKLSQLFCFVLTGAFDIRREVQTGGMSRSHTIARIGQGACVGEGALLEECDSFCTITAVEVSNVVVLSKDQFEDFLLEHPVDGCLFLKKILTGVHQRLGNSSARLAHIL